MRSLPFRAIAFDIDDTLTESKQPIENDLALLLSKLCNNVPVAIISGAKLSQIEEQIIHHVPNPILSHFFLFPTSGASAYTYDSAGKISELYVHKLSEKEIEEITTHVKEVLQETSITQGVETYGNIIELRGSGIAISLLGQEAPPALKKIFDPDQQKRKLLLPLLKERLPQFEIHIGGSTTIDITKKGIDKAYGMQQFSKIINIKEEDMLYVGDALYEGGNDAAIFKTKMTIHKVLNRDDTAIFLTSLFHENNF